MSPEEDIMNGVQLSTETKIMGYSMPMNVSSDALDQLIIRWEQTRDRTCPVLGTPVAFEQVLAGQYALPRYAGDSANGYEVWPSSEFLQDIARNIATWLLKEASYKI